MKKKAVAILIALASLLAPVHAENQSIWYFGTKLGWSQFNPLLKHNTNDSNTDREHLSAPIVGFFLGYEFNPYFSLETENYTNGFSPHLLFKKDEKLLQHNSLSMLTKLSYPVTDDFRFYTKLGATMFWSDIFSRTHFNNMFNKESAILPTVSLGAEYILNKNMITRFDYTWKNSIKNISNKSIVPNLGDAVLSIGWRFGESEFNNIFSENEDTESNKYSVLNTNINFPFNSTELKPFAYDKLNQLNHDIKAMQLKNVSIVLLGHADKIGSEEYNQKLSEDRAYSIKNYLTSRGFSQDQITIQGMGSLYPLTNQVCQNIKNKSLLISCLAPDRRVEIEVLSSTDAENNN